MTTAPDPAPTVTTSGRATLEVEPTLARVHGRIEVVGDDTSAVREQLASIQETVRERLDGRVAFEQIRTWEDRNRTDLPVRDETGTLVVRRRGQVRLVATPPGVDEVGAFVEALLDSRVDLDRIDWAVAADDPARSQVRAAAARDAVARARDYAAALDLDLGPVRHVRDGAASGPEPRMRMAAMSAEAAPALDLLPDTIRLTEHVEITHDLRLRD